MCADLVPFHTDPGGPARTVDLGDAVLAVRSVSSMDNNAYLVTCSVTGQQLLVDAAADAPALRDLVQAGTGRLDAIVTTHQHWDHHRALAELVAEHSPRTFAGADDADGLPVATDVRLGHGETVSLGRLELAVLALRGHTPGSIALALRPTAGPPLLFTGDSLFPGGPGKTPDAAAFTSLMDDLEGRVFDAFPDETVVLPGHGDSTTIGAQRPAVDQGAWRARGW